MKKYQKNLLIPLLMATVRLSSLLVVMMAMSPQRVWADSQFTYKATEDLSETFQNAFGDENVTCGEWTDENTEVTVTVAGSVTSIGEQAFQYCSNLISITLPSSVESIGDNAFDECYGLTSITLPSSLESIGESAFNGCYGLTSITLPSSVTSIGDGAFADCSVETEEGPSGLVLVYCEGESPADLGGYAFGACNNLVAIIVPADGVESYQTNWSEYSENIVSANAVITYTASEKLTLSFNPKSHSYNAGTGIIILNDDDLTSIDGWVDVNDVSKLTSVTLPNSVTSIGGIAFNSFENLTSISLSSSLTSIADHAFNSCEKLTSITFPDGLKSIGNNAFAGCSGLTDVSFSSIPQVGSDAFDGCTNLNTLTLTLTDDSYVASDKGDFPTLTEEPTFTRTLSTEWETVVLPFALTISANDNYEIYTVDGVTGSYLLTKKATGTLAAGTPVLIRKKVTGNYDLTFTASNTTVNTSISNPAAVSGLTFTGTYATAPVALGAGYVFNGTTFSKTTADTDVAPFHAYLAGEIQGVSTLTPHIHTLTATEEKEATCTEDGNEAYWTCSVCEKVFSDAAGTTETTLADVTVATTDHVFTNKTLATEPEENGLYAYVCDNGCGEKQEGVKVLKNYAPNTENPNLELTELFTPNAFYITQEELALTDANQFAGVNVVISSEHSNYPSYTRNVTSEWSTLVLPFSFYTDEVEGYAFFSITGYNSTTGALTISKFSGGNPAGQPLLVRKLTDEPLTITGIENRIYTSLPDTYVANAALVVKGTYEIKSLEEGYIIHNDAFWSVASLLNDYSGVSSVKIAPFRFYVEELELEPVGPNWAKLQIVEEDETTSLTPTLSEGEGAQSIYNLQGQKLAAPQKGVNIVDGKKIMVK